MKNFLTNRLLSKIIFLLIIIVIVKLIWIIVSILFLPTSGVEHIEKTKFKSLYYRAELAVKSDKTAINKIVKEVKKAPPIISMRGIKLLALYNSKETLVVTVEKNRKTKILSKGETIDGFKLKSAGNDYAIFTKNSKKFKLLLEGSRIKNPSAIEVVKSPLKSTHGKKRVKDNGIVQSGNGNSKIVSKRLLTSYTKDIDKIWRDIGIGEHKTNGILDGFKVNFVRKGSDFEKLGLRRGDILKSVNGQELNSYNAAFSFYQEIGDIDNLTLGIVRNNQDMELEYEIH
jgi:general secretion pathway protein C